MKILVYQFTIFWITSACIATFEFAPSQAQNNISTRVIAKNVNDDERVRENFQNLFNSIARNDDKKSDAYRKVLEEEVVKERNAFDVMKNELRTAHNRNKNREYHFYGRNKLRNVSVSKRENGLDTYEQSTATITALKLGNRCTKLPSTDVMSFETLVNTGCYVDKTEYLSKFIVRKSKGTSPKTFSLARPRGFGKSILVDTIFEFFQGEDKRELFKDTYIGQHHPQPWIKYPVIRLDFSAGIVTESVSKFSKSLEEKLQDEARSNGIKLKRSTMEGVLEEFILELSKKNTNSKVIVLIDKYDSPYTRAYETNRTEAEKIWGNMLSFYSTIKGMKTNIHLIFVTGVSRIPLSDFNSGDNTFTDLTTDSDYSGIVGFTETELYTYFGAHIKSVAEKRGKTPEEILEIMRKWHNGFRFSKNEETLYSPCSVFRYLQTEGVNVTLYSATAGAGKFFLAILQEFPDDALKLLIEHRANKLAGKTYHTQLMATRAELTGKIGYTLRDYRVLVPLLFHYGYLSISTYDIWTDSFTLKFTNSERENDYALRLRQIDRHTTSPFLMQTIRLITQDLDNYKWEDFIKKLDTYFANVPYFLSVDDREGREVWFQWKLFLMLDHAGYREEPGVEDSTNKGRSDIVVCNQTTIYIFQLKTEENPEHPIYECSQKYIQKQLYKAKNVVCVGLRFSPKAEITSWGAAVFSFSGDLISQHGPITLTIQLSSEELEVMKKSLEDYKSKNPGCTLQLEKIIELLKIMGLSKKHPLELAETVTKNTDTLCSTLKEIRNSLTQENLRSLIHSFVKTVEKANRGKGQNT